MTKKHQKKKKWKNRTIRQTCIDYEYSQIQGEAE